MPSRRPNRSELMNIMSKMAEEFEWRADADARDPERALDVTVHLRTAKYFRELLSIARGRRAPTYWTRRRSHTALAVAE